LTKVVRAFSLDQRVSEDLDLNTRVPGLSKPMNKSKYVNEALDFYMNRNLKEMIEQNRTLKRNLTGGLIQRDQEIEKLVLTIGGLEADLAESLASKAPPDCRCLWCRLKRRLKI
jgi:hypothetical protein